MLTPCSCVPCREDAGTLINSCNSSIRKVNAAIIILNKRPPMNFPREVPLALKEHMEANKEVLRVFETNRSHADQISWEKDAADTQAQLIAHHYFVRASPLVHLHVLFYCNLAIAIAFSIATV